MTGCLVEEQLENTELAWPLSDRDTVSEAEQSGGRDSLLLTIIIIIIIIIIILMLDSPG